jgi:16S rRNA (adenine1518-N6/adenine1519-N6)-dimethyltransferase
VTLTRQEVGRLLAEHGLHPSRALGQNFVVDANTVRRIARLADVGVGDRVVEIGAGLGSLTIALAETGAEVRAVEIDRHLVPILRHVVESLGVTVIEGDAMRIDWADVLGDEVPPPALGGAAARPLGPLSPALGGAAARPLGPLSPALGGAATRPLGPWVLVANLPYNVATPLVADLLDTVPAVSRMLVMVQREVGQRLVAAAGADPYGAVSVKVAYWAVARIVGRVPASVFVPRPNVESVLVDIRRRAVPAVDPSTVDPAALFSLVRAGFSQRRKMLRRSLAGLVPLEAWAEAGVDPSTRAEQLDVTAWGRLAAACARGRPAVPSAVGRDRER